MKYGVFVHKQMMQKSARGLSLLALLCSTVLLASPSHGQNRTPNQSNPAANEAPSQEYSHEMKVEIIPAPPSRWTLPIVHKTTTLRPDLKSLRARIEALSITPDLAEPVVLRVLKEDPFALLRQLGNKVYIEKFINGQTGPATLRDFSDRVMSRIVKGRLSIVPSDLDWLDLDKLSQTLQTSSAAPYVSVADWKAFQRRADADELGRDFFGKDYEKISHDVLVWIKENPHEKFMPLQVFIPPHLRSLYGRFSHLRGRNCFGTALEFATPRSTLDKQINLQEEPGHYKAMINSDELMHALWLGYYELRPEEILAGLKWGDIVVFYEEAEAPSYTSLRHAAVHLAGDIYFQKQSKSPASPIELTEWDSVVEVWSYLTKNLNYKVYRHLPIGRAGFQKPGVAIEKISWTR